MKKIAAILGDYYHPQEWINESLHEALKKWKEKGGVRLQVIEAEQLISVLEEKPDAVVLFKENRINPQDETVRYWMKSEVARAIVKYVEQGGGWLAWHSGLASYDQVGVYLKMLRGVFQYHPENHQPVTYQGEPTPFLNQMSYQFVDEHYFVKCEEERTDIFLRSESVDGHSIAGWAHEYGSGRVCCYAPAHNREGLMDPGVRQHVEQIIRWCSKAT